jgi:nicotinate-nucleotide pyrophosphorylase (carboxylating)
VTFSPEAGASRAVALDAGMPDAEADGLVTAALEEDVGEGDFTTLWTVAEGTRARGTVVSREPAVVAGSQIAERVFHRVDPRLRLETVVRDGGSVEAGATILTVEGSARSILTGERTALNFLARLSGIATLTRAFVRAVEGTNARILDTRKTTPGWRALEKWAVRLGGGDNHRMGLYDMVLVKDNHIAAAGGAGAAVRAVARENRRALPVEAEVTGMDELAELRGLPIDRVLIDNMTVEGIAAVVREVSGWDPRPELEASGNMTLERVRSVAETGVDWISVGALTHSARWIDLSLELPLS